MELERKNFAFAVKALDDEQGSITAYGSVFDNTDEGGDVVRPGAFKRTLINAKARIAAGKSSQVAVMLWQHDPQQPIGSWTEITEDAHGLLCKGKICLDTQLGREAYALVKNGILDQLSIGYDIPAGGVHYDKSGVRELTELRLWEVSLVTFAMNPEALVQTVKSAGSGDDAPTVCGNTKGPLGPRDEAWDGAKAEGQIWAAAHDADAGTINTTLARKYFLLCSGDGAEKGDYSLPFWYVGSNPHICVGAVKAIANAVQGGRGTTTDYPDGVKAKVESLYRRINAKYPDDPQLTPPWQASEASGEKGARMPANKAAGERQKKTFQEHYTEQQCCDLLRDWQDVVLSAFTSAVYDAFQIGDQPEADIAEALDALKGAVMDWVAEGTQYGLSDYLDAQGYDGGTESRMQNGTSYGYYGYMSRSTPLHQKAMTAGDATTGGFTTDHVDKLHGAADKASKAVEKHVATLADAAESVKSLIGQAAKAAKAGRTFSAANEQALADHADALDGAANSLSKAMTRHLGTVNSVADDLATVLQGSESAYGSDAGTPATGSQEGKQHRASSTKTRAAHTPPSQRGDTVSESDVAAALATLRTLRTA